METLFDYLDLTFSNGSSSSELMKYFNKQLYGDFNPDITGYTLALMVPPDLSGYRVNKNMNNFSQDDPTSYMGEVANIMSFAAVDFTPPQSQVNTESISSRTGAIPYATEVSESEQCSVTFVENASLDIYMFHHIWLEYIREILEGVIDPAPEYLDPNNSEFFGKLDYAASLYILKYRPDMRNITFASKCMGIFPQGLPSKELIGTRTSNELTTLPFNYFCAAYRETTYMETGNWILSEVDNILSKFGSVSGLGSMSNFLDMGLKLANSVIGASELVSKTGRLAQRISKTVSGISINGIPKVW